MNKKLIKQLKGVGFASKVSGGIRISLEVKGGYAFDYYEGDDRIHFYKDNETVATSIESPMFAQIVAKVKDITGVDLAKKTKREEIEELKVRVGKMEDAMKSQNDVIEGLKGRINPTKRKCFFGLDYGLDAVDALAYSVNQMIRKDVNKLIEQGDERILSKLKPIDTSKLKQAIKNMQGMFDKQASKMQAKEKKGFSVGDPVVIVCGKRLGFNGDLCRAIENKSIIKVANVNNKDKCVCVILNDIEYYFKFDELEHVFKNKGINKGDFVVLSKDLLKEPITEEVIEAVNLQTVFEVLNIENGVYYLDKKLHKGESWTMEECDIEHAPEESPKEKALEFGKYAEILEVHPSKTSYCKGVDVLVIDDTDRPNVTVVMNGHYPVDLHESNLKPL